MQMSLHKIFYFNFLLMFIVGFCHFVIVEWMHLNIDSLLYLILLTINFLIIIRIKNVKINKSIFKISIFIFFLVILLLYSTFIQFLSYAIFYNIYLIMQLLLFGIIFSNINYEEFKNIILQYRNAYLIVNIPLFLLYIVDILSIYNFPNGFIVFDYYRFGGFVSEPRGLAIFTFLALLSVLIVKRKKYQKFEILF